MEAARARTFLFRIFHTRATTLEANSNLQFSIHCELDSKTWSKQALALFAKSWFIGVWSCLCFVYQHLRQKCGETGFIKNVKTHFRRKFFSYIPLRISIFPQSNFHSNSLHLTLTMTKACFNCLFPRLLIQENAVLTWKPFHTYTHMLFYTCSSKLLLLLFVPTDWTGTAKSS